MVFIEQAYKGKNEWWMYLLGFIIIFIFWQIIGVIPFLITIVVHSSDAMEAMQAMQDNFLSLGINKNLMLFMMLLSGVFGFFAVKYVVKYLHLRSFKSVITARKKVDWNRILFGFIIIFAFQIVSVLFMIYGGENELVWNFKPMPFLILFMISFLLFPFQTGTEELIFRGYLMQGTGILTKSRLAALLLTSVVFGIIHGVNPEVAALGWTVMIFYIGSGLLYGIATLMDDGMELALGMHAANNISASLLVTASWTVIQTEALYIDNAEPSAGLEMYLPVFVIFPIILFIFSKKYGWKNWKEKLTGTIIEPV
jgi:membrane protease YdiL (CAAX protease family)